MFNALTRQDFIDVYNRTHQIKITTEEVKQLEQWQSFRSGNNYIPVNCYPLKKDLVFFYTPFLKRNWNYGDGDDNLWLIFVQDGEVFGTLIGCKKNSYLYYKKDYVYREHNGYTYKTYMDKPVLKNAESLKVLNDRDFTNLYCDEYFDWREISIWNDLKYLTSDQKKHCIMHDFKEYYDEANKLDCRYLKKIRDELRECVYKKENFNPDLFKGTFFLKMPFLDLGFNNQSGAMETYLCFIHDRRVVGCLLVTIGGYSNLLLRYEKGLLNNFVVKEDSELSQEEKEEKKKNYHTYLYSLVYENV